MPFILFEVFFGVFLGLFLSIPAKQLVIKLCKYKQIINGSDHSNQNIISVSNTVTALAQCNLHGLTIPTDSAAFYANIPKQFSR